MFILFYQWCTVTQTSDLENNVYLSDYSVSMCTSIDSLYYVYESNLSKTRVHHNQSMVYIEILKKGQLIQQFKNVL